MRVRLTNLISVCWPVASLRESLLGAGVVVLAMLDAGAALAQGAPTAQPANDPSAWVSDADYPDSALRTGISGRVGFRLSISPEGRPTDCAISESSGSVLLDRKTCLLLLQRAQFKPVLDADGHPVASTFANRVAWVAPESSRPPEPYSVEISLVVGADGRGTSCTRTVFGSGTPPPDVAEGMNSLCSGALFEPYLDVHGQPVARKVTMRTSVAVTPVK
jgi:TonB family protein